MYTCTYSVTILGNKVESSPGKKLVLEGMFNLIYAMSILSEILVSIND